MFKSLRTALVIVGLMATAASAQNQNPPAQSQDRQAQEQAERDRKQAEKEQKAKDKAGKKEPGSRCARWKSGKA